MSIISRILALFLVFQLSGCMFGWLKTTKKGENTEGWTVTQFYEAGKQDMEDADWKSAIAFFIALEARYPYGRYAQQAQLYVAYAHYKEDDQDAAILAADRFIRLHPNHPSVDYAYYIKGLSSFNDEKGMAGYVMKNWIDQHMSERDPKASNESFQSFKELVTRFPDSPYRADSIKRMNFLFNTVAMGEIYVARYYMSRGAYVAAINRAQFTLNEFPQTPATKHALEIMVEAYDELGMDDLRDDAKRVMQKSFSKDQESLDITNLDSVSWNSGKKYWWKFW
jgi:outer membrane protein assembly factor BamD